jgi:hypothetical protein
MFDLKPISPAAIPNALLKAERYRLLNEPEEAESICLDVLAVDPDNQQALVTLILSLTDQFDTDLVAQCAARAHELLPRLRSEYERAYYSGIICERRGQARMKQVAPGAEAIAYGLLRQAMDFYEEAESLSPAGTQDALLRWNTCVRTIVKHGLAPWSESDNYETAPLE